MRAGSPSARSRGVAPSADSAHSPHGADSARNVEPALDVLHAVRNRLARLRLDLHPARRPARQVPLLRGAARAHRRCRLHGGLAGTAVPGPACRPRTRGGHGARRAHRGNRGHGRQRTSSTQFWAFLLARFLLGLGSGTVSPAIRRMIVNASADELGREPRQAGRVRDLRLRAGPARRRRRRAALRPARAVHLPGRAVLRRPCLLVRLQLSAGPHSDKPQVIRRLLGATGDARGTRLVRRVLRHDRNVRGGLGDPAARPWSLDLAHRADALAVHRPDDFPGAARGSRRQRRGPMRVAAVSITVATALHLQLRGAAEPVAAAGGFADPRLCRLLHLPANQVAAAMAAPRADASSGQGLLGATGLAAAGISGLASGYMYEHSAGQRFSAVPRRSWPASSGSRSCFQQGNLRPVAAERAERHP